MRTECLCDHGRRNANEAPACIRESDGTLLAKAWDITVACEVQDGRCKAPEALAQLVDATLVLDDRWDERRDAESCEATADGCVRKRLEARGGGLSWPARTFGQEVLRRSTRAAREREDHRGEAKRRRDGDERAEVGTMPCQQCRRRDALADQLVGLQAQPQSERKARV